MKKLRLGLRSTWESFLFFIGMVIILLITIIAIKTVPNDQISPRTSSSLNSPANSIVDNQADLREGWKKYVSPLGYSIAYPSDWFVSPDPAIDRADIIYEDENFLKIRSGEKLVDHSQLSSYIVIGVQEFNFNNLNLNTPDSFENITKAIDGEAVKVLQESPLGTDTDSSFRLTKAQGELRMTTYFTNGERFYMITSALSSRMDTDRVELFKQIASSFRITK